MPAEKSYVPDVEAISRQIKEMIGQFKVPGIDAQGMVEQHRKNIDAIVETMRVANKGTHTVAEHQLELFHTASAQLLSMFSAEKLTAEQRAELARKAYEAALAGSQEVYDISIKASEEAFSIARRRVTEGVEEFKKQLDRKAGDK